MDKQAFIIGTFVDGDVNVERFRTTVLRLNYDLHSPINYADAIRRLSYRKRSIGDDGRDLVLFCIGAELQAIPRYLEAIRAPQRQVIVYAHPRRASPQSAIEYCHTGLADDYLVSGEPITADRMEEHVKALDQRRSPYPTIDVINGTPARVFIATPYDRDNRMVMSDAVDHVLERVNLTPCWADAFYRDSSIPSQVLTEIHGSDMLIANIRQGPSAIHNPNVYYEAGQATALGKPVIFVRPVTEKDLLVPADISDRRIINYDNPIDLSMRLYCGLRKRE